MNRKILLVIAALLVVWGFVDFYHYAFIGREMLVHYAGVTSVQELVNSSLIHGLVKTALGLVITAGLFLTRKKGETR